MRLLETDDENLECLFSRFFCEKQGLTIFPHCRILISHFVCKNLITRPQTPGIAHLDFLSDDFDHLPPQRKTTITETI